MKASIIISAHKESKFLGIAIESALNQDFKEEYEIILSSDGCDLKEVAQKYGIKYCYTHKSSHSHALNRTVKKAKGEWIKELHYDDFLTSDCLTKLLTNVEADTSFVYGNAINFYESGREKLYKSKPDVTFNDFFPPVKTVIHSESFAYTKESFIIVGGRDINMDISEEVDFYLNMLKSGFKFQYVDATVAYYRVHSDSKTGAYNEAKRNEVRKYLLEKYND